MRQVFQIIIFLSLTVPCIKAQTVKNFPYIDPTPGEISIMACSPFQNFEIPTKQEFQEIVNCGFNLVTSSGSVEYFKNIFASIENLPLKYFISNQNFIKQDTRNQYINAFKDNPHLGGWLLKDEPFIDTWDSLSEAYKEFYNEDSNHIVLVNLVGILVRRFTGDSKTMLEYLQTFNSMFRPSLWSYDFYPIIKKNGKLIIEYDQFYTDLETFYYMSKQTKRPFWAFCETMEYTTNTYSRPSATEAYLSFEAFSALAYGAQGIIYWTYGMRNSTDSEKYISALVDVKGKKTPAWFAAQKVNSNIKKFNHVFYQCNVIDVRHTGDKIFQGTRKLSGTFGPFKMIRSGKAGVLVSLIENNGKEYVVVVSHDVLSKQKVTFELLPNKTITDLTNNKSYNWRQDFSLILDKGGYFIFEII